MIKYEDLKKAAREVRMELTEKGLIDPSSPKIRKKPRDSEKTEMLYMMARNRMEKYPPRLTSDRMIVLPYFKS